MTLPFNLTPLAMRLIGGALAIVIAVILFLTWLHGREKQAVQRDRAEAAQSVAKTTERAERAADGQIRQVQDEVRQGNDDARTAAAQSSDDPLSVGFERLRAGQQARNRPAAH